MSAAIRVRSRSRACSATNRWRCSRLRARCQPPRTRASQGGSSAAGIIDTV
ncbi:hypothetical protein [Streptomyces sp. NPDC056491]|uniref:hypothetical protein n=1 Tax=Streptomyces sp. NPDC056491 TaxID=3345837 RepID=UPI0036744B50